MIKMKHSWIVVGAALIALGTTAGCMSRKLHLDSRLPDQPQLVGGGMMIEWKAPEAGTAYLIEKQTGKIIETRSLETDDMYSFTATSVVQADEFEQMLGIKFARAHFLLYFEPASREDSTLETGAPARRWSGF